MCVRDRGLFVRDLLSTKVTKNVFSTSRSGQTEDLKNGTCAQFSLVLGVDGRVQGKGSRVVLPSTCHQCSIHCESSRVAHGASKR